MSILNRDCVPFTGQHPCPEFDVPQGELPGKLKVLLCLIDGAERRRHLQAKLNSLNLAQRATGLRRAWHLKKPLGVLRYEERQMIEERRSAALCHVDEE